MNKFSSLKPLNTEQKKDNNVIYKDDILKVIKYEDCSIVTGKDVVVVIPYLIEQNQIILRQEYVPSFKYSSGQQMHIVLIGGGIEKGETPEESMLRELQEEAGIVVRPNFKIDMGKPLFISKGNANKIYFTILTLNENDYHEIAVDKTEEHKLDKAAKVDIKYINSLNISDVVTELAIEKFKRYINL